MANWCSNNVQFEGAEFQLKQVQQLFEAMSAAEEKEGCGQLPEFIKDGRGYFFSIRWEEDVLYYETKWCPNSDILVKIADHFKVDFVHKYEECGMLIFGETQYSNGILTITDLETEDFNLFEYDEEKDNWLFAGQHYESDYEIKEILLERKKQSD